MKPLSIIQLILIAGCWRPAAYGQGNSVSKNVISKLTTFSAKHPSEKAYLQFDKPYYTAGDTIYFKAYVTEGEQHRLSGLSGVLHVDLINTKNKIDQSIKLRLDSGIAWGDFALPDSLPKGNYRVRAYTRWMRNDDQPGFFDKIIPIGSINPARVPESVIKQPAQPAGLKPDVQFFPEGGSLVTGIRSKVAFKATGINGLGINVSGKVVDNEGNEIVSFASANLGMGYFYLNPAAGKTYKAAVIYPNGMNDMIDLPKPEPGGIVLSIDNDSVPKATVKIEANNEYYKNNRGKDYTLVICSGALVTTVNCRLDSSIIALDILKRKLHTGIATVTLFSPGNEPLDERLIFIQNYDRLNLNVSSNKNSYRKREKVNIRLNAINRKGEPAEGHFSVSVIDENKVSDSENNGDNILSYFLLTSDLKGYVEQSGNYFADTSAATRRNLDILMLTQGYRRFSWKQVLDDHQRPLAYQPEKGIEIAGQVTSLFNKPIANGTVTLIPAYKGPVFSATTDDKGMFRFSDLIFTDTAHFVLSAVNAKNKNSTKITYFNDGKDKPGIIPNNRQTLLQVSNTAMATYLDNDQMQHDAFIKFNRPTGKMLKEVQIKAKEIPQRKSQSYVAEFAADQVIRGKDIPYGGPLAVRLSGLLRGAHIYPLPGNRFSIINNITRGPMATIIDGAPGDINDLSTNDIDRIDILRPPNSYIYGSGGGNGVLVVTTKPRTMEAGDMVSIGVLPISPVGFYKVREFYSPKYENPHLTTKQRDLRSTIYWQPEIKTDKDGNASFEYYNADGAGTYKVVVEGIDNNGNIGRQVYRYKVE